MDLAPETVGAAARRQRESSRNPAKSVEEYLDSIARSELPQTVLRLRTMAELL